MGIFDGLGGSRTLEHGRYFPPGRFVGEVGEAKVFPSRDPTKRGAMNAVVTFRIVGAEMRDADMEWLAAHPENGAQALSPGSEATFYTDVADSQMGLPKLKSFLLGVFPEHAAEINSLTPGVAEGFAERVFGEAQYGAGRRVFIESTPTVTKKSGRAICVQTYRLLTPALAAQLAASTEA